MVLALKLLLGFVCFEAFGWGLHKFLHWNGAGGLYKAHLTHHRLYPPSNFLSREYRSAGVDSTLWRFVVGIAVLIVLMLVVFPLWMALMLSAELVVLGLVNNYVHDAIHIRGHWLERFAIYRRWREMHLVHHVDTRKNLGILTFLADRVAGTFKKPFKNP